MKTRLFAALLSLPVVTTPAPAQDVAPFPLDVTARRGLLDTVELAPRADALARLAPLSLVRLTGVPLPDGREVELDLVRVSLDASSIGLWVDGVHVPEGIDPGDLTLWKGSVRGAGVSDVFVAFSSRGSHGWIRADGELVHLIGQAGPGGDWSRSIARLVPDATLMSLGPGPGEVCAIDKLSGGPTTMAPSSTGTTHSAGAPATLHCPMAIETDYQLFQVFGDLAAMQTYVLTLLGAKSDRYEEQIDTVLTYPYLAFYTTSNDPWTSQDTGGNSVDLLYEFRAAWQFNIPADAKLAHFLSGASLGGGVAWVDVLCNQNYGFAVSGNINGGVTFPVQQGSNTWDFMVACHETGHNFGTSHTHNYCPPIDSCAPSGYFGQCQTQQVCTNQGTVMSYCHLCSGGMSNMTNYFHPTVVDVMRTAAEASCLDEWCDAPTTYCTAKLNSAGCLPGMGYSGSPSFSGPDDFHVTASDVVSNQYGFLLWSRTQNALPFYGGTLCIAMPIARTPVQISGGNSAPLDCSGTFSFHLSQAYMSSASILAGDMIYLQYWYRDPGTAELVGLTDALSVTICDQ